MRHSSFAAMIRVSRSQSNCLPQFHRHLDVSRQLQAMDLSRILNEDVLIQIFNHVGQLSLLNASLVCKRWHEVAQQIIDSTVTLALAEVYEERNLRLFKRIRSDDAFRQRIHRVVVRDWHHTKLEEIRGDWPWLDGGYFSQTYIGSLDEWWETTREQIEDLARCLRVLDLTSFTWAAVPQLPQLLIAVLRGKQNECQIHIKKNELWSENAIWAYSPFLNHRGLTHLDFLSNVVSLEFIIAPADPGLLEELGVFLASRRQTLRTLKLKAFGQLWPGSRAHVNWSDDVTRIDDPRLFLVRSTNWLTDPLGDEWKRLNLTNLELTNICVCTSARPSRLDEMTDVHRLASLKLSCFGFLNQCSSSDFSSLHTLSISFRNGYVMDREKCSSDWSSGSIRAFLIRCKNLRHLDLIDRPNILSEGLLKTMGSNLRALDIHQTISCSPVQQTSFNLHYPTAAPEDRPEKVIDIISRNCPKLKELRISVAQHWPQVSPEQKRRYVHLLLFPNLYKFEPRIGLIAKSFPNLQVLHLYREVEPYNLEHSEAAEKSFNKSTMLPIWDRYHEPSIGHLLEMAIHMQILVSPGRYNQIYRRERVPARTYIAKRCFDQRLNETSGVNVAMVELEQSTREMFEKAPQSSKCRLSVLHGQLKLLCDEGQPLNTGITRKCYR